MTLVIGITGPAGSGKTTVAQYLERHYGARRYALAAPLKEIVQRAFDLRPEQLWGPQHIKATVDPRYGVSPRWLMQHIGTDGIRSVLGDDFWVRYVMDQIRREGPSLAVVEDVRFLSEASGLRPAWIWKVLPWKADDDQHQSETEWKHIQEDHLVAPALPGLDALYLAIDAACASFNLMPTMHSVEAP